jgi:hypothetical protein
LEITLALTRPETRNQKVVSIAGLWFTGASTNQKLETKNQKPFNCRLWFAGLWSLVQRLFHLKLETRNQKLFLKRREEKARESLS